MRSVVFKLICIHFFLVLVLSDAYARKEVICELNANGNYVTEVAPFNRIIVKDCRPDTSSLIGRYRTRNVRLEHSVAEELNKYSTLVLQSPYQSEGVLIALLQDMYVEQEFNVNVVNSIHINAFFLLKKEGKYFLLGEIDTFRETTANVSEEVDEVWSSVIARACKLKAYRDTILPEPEIYNFV
jgi:hypothetical protein